MHKIDWQALFFDPQARWAERVQRLARRRVGDSTDADAACNFVLEAISAQDWCRLREGFQGRGSPEGFLAVTIANLIDDYAVSKYGRKRPPRWLQRLGGYWTLVYDFLCMKRMEAETVVDMICARGAYAADDVRYAISQVRARIPGCGQHYGELTQAPDELDQGTSGSNEPGQDIAAAQLSTVLKVLGGLFRGHSNDEVPATSTTAIDPGRLAQLQECMKLSDIERLLLRLVYQDGFSIARAARSLQMHEQKTRRAMKGLLTRLRSCLDVSGIM